MVSKKIAPLIAAALLVAPAAASAQAVSPPGAGSLSVAAAMQSSGGEAGLGGLGASTLAPIFILAMVVLVGVASQGGSDSPDSP